MIDKDELINLCDNHIEEILDKLNLDWVKENGWICMPCCFHGGVKRNLKYRDKHFYCFSECRQAYNIIQVVQHELNLDFSQAISWLSSMLGISNSDLTLTATKMASRERLKKLKSLTKKKTHNKYKQVSQTTLNDIEEYYHPYLLNKGYKKDTLKYFDIGYCRYGELANRIVFKIDAPDGTIISLSGRSVDGSEPKYHIIYETDKSETLYGISKINKQDNYIIVVEGFKSVLSLYQWGFKSVVAVMGSDISDEQIKLLLKLGRKVICISDNDKAGRRLNQKIYNRLYKYLPVVKIDMSEFAEFEKDSPCHEDLDFDSMCDLTDKISEVIQC